MAWMNLPKTGPDSWQGFRVALRCMCVMALTAGNMRASGVIYVGIMNHFGVSREEAAWPVSLAGAMLSLIGTVSGPLAQAFSPKPVILCGSIMIVIGLLASVFAPNLAWLTFTYGLVFGSGLGTVYQINVIFLQQYFIKMRGLALGMNYAGSTTAGFVFPIFIAFLLGEYGFQGTLLIVSGVLMHIFVLCLTHKEAPWLQKKTDGGENSEVIKSKTPGTSHSEAVPCRNGVVSSGASEETPEPNEVLRATVDLHGQEMTKESEDQSSVPAEEPQTVGSELKEPRDVESTAVKSEFLKHETSVSVELPTVPAEKEASTGKVSLVASLSILKIPEFHVIIFSFSLYFYAYDAYFTTIVDFIVDQNISLAKATTIVPLYSITDMVARLVIPQLGDRGYINKMLLQCFAYALQSACFFLMPTAAATGNFFWIAALAMVQSTGVGTAIVMYGVLMGELIGVQRLPMAYGIVGLFVGLTYVTKPFFVGYFRDTIGDYSMMYIACGVLTSISSLCWLITWYVHRSIKQNRTPSITPNEAAENVRTSPMNRPSSINDDSKSIGQRSRADSGVFHL